MKRRSGRLSHFLFVFTMLCLPILYACASSTSQISSSVVSPISTDNVVVSYPTFNPENIMVPAGVTVTWTNRDNTPYLIADNEQTFAFNLPASGTYTMSFEEAGVYNYHCSEHPAMQGTVTVLSGVTARYFSPQNLLASRASMASEKQERSPLITEIETKISPSVVAIEAVTVSHDASGKMIEDGLYGTGWIVRDDGIIVTNNHVLSRATEVTITLNNGKSYTASRILTDSVDDLALIKIDVSGLPALNIADSTKVKTGDLVVAMGDIDGEGIRANQGTISATGVTFRVPARETLYNMIETTASVNFGDSGGPLVDVNGNVVGVTSGATMTLDGTPVAGYAISSNTAGSVIHELLEKGFVSRAYIGVNAADAADARAVDYVIEANEGAFLIKVDAGSPAEQSGMKAGDVITGFNGSPTPTADDLVQLVRDCTVGQKAQITYFRGASETTTTIITAQYPQK